MSIEDEIEIALRSSDRLESLSRIAVALLDTGKTEDEVLEVFEHFRAKLGSERDVDDDEIIGVMDLVCGWCAPGQKLQPTRKTDLDK